MNQSYLLCEVSTSVHLSTDLEKFFLILNFLPKSFLVKKKFDHLMKKNMLKPLKTKSYLYLRCDSNDDIHGNETDFHQSI